VFIAANRCPLSDVTGRLAEVSRLLRRFGILFPRSDFVSQAPESPAPPFSERNDEADRPANTFAQRAMTIV
jgi:hypothetical protein